MSQTGLGDRDWSFKRSRSMIWIWKEERVMRRYGSSCTSTIVSYRFGCFDWLGCAEWEYTAISKLIIHTQIQWNQNKRFELPIKRSHFQWSEWITSPWSIILFATLLAKLKIGRIQNTRWERVEMCHQLRQKCTTEFRQKPFLFFVKHLWFVTVLPK